MIEIDQEGRILEDILYKTVTSRKALLNMQNRLSGYSCICEMDRSTYFEIDESSDWEIIDMIAQRTDK